MQGDDLYSGMALSGAGTGAASGAMMGSSISPGYGTVIGGLIGGGIGLFTGAEANSMRSDATKQQNQNLDKIMAELSQQSKTNYDQHIADLNKALDFYGPAQSYWDRLYGTGGAKTTGQGSWAGTSPVTGGTSPNPTASTGVK